MDKAQPETTRLSVADSEKFVDAVLNPPEPNEALKAAAERYKATIRTFGGYTPLEVAELCDLLAGSADRMTNSYSETASIARRARDVIRFLMGEDVADDV